MQITSDIIYGFLEERFSLGRHGARPRKRELALPFFYNPDLPVQNGATYVARTQDLQHKPEDDCLIIALGPSSSNLWNLWPCEIIHIEDSHIDLVSAFNVVQRLYGRLVRWSSHMQQMASDGADIRLLVEESIPLFENRITVTDFALRVIAYCSINEKTNSIEMSSEYDLVPASKLRAATSRAKHIMRSREPYFVEEEGRGDNYCINLFMGDNYVGTCSLQQDLKPLRPCDLELFGVFTDFVRQAFATQTASSGGQLVSSQLIFEQLLNRFPVSQTDVNDSLELTALNLGMESLDTMEWYCVVVQSANHRRTLPEHYLTESIEHILPNTTSFIFNDSVVAFCLLPQGASPGEEICDLLEPFLADLNCLAGISRGFIDIYEVAKRYEQALGALACANSSEAKRCLLFDECALDYMLRNSAGSLGIEAVVAPELGRLAASGTGNVDYIETLRNYLDYDCNASKTAAAMHLHRSTLTLRLEHIEKYVDLNSPDKRLYLRMCLHLPNVNFSYKQLQEYNINQG